MRCASEKGVLIEINSKSFKQSGKATGHYLETQNSLRQAMIDKTEKVLQVMLANPSWSLVSLQTYKPFYTERFINFQSDN